MILLTGATGLVGSHLLLFLLQSGYDVKALKRKNSNIEKLRTLFSYYTSDFNAFYEKIIWIESDVLDYSSLNRAVKGCDVVYHAAAMVSFAPEDKELMMRTNIEGTANVVKACVEKKIKKLCHVSSVSALGSSKNGNYISEQTQWLDTPQTSNYSRSKYFSEREVWKGIQNGLCAVIVNPTVILGPGNWNDGSPALFNTVWKGLRFYTTGTSGFVDVHDVVRIMVKLAHSEIASERFIINSENVNYKELLSSMAQFLGKPKPTFKVTKAMAEIAWRIEKIRCFLMSKKPLITKETVASARKQNFYSNEKIVRFLNYNFLSVEESIRQTTAIFLKEKTDL